MLNHIGVQEIDMESEFVFIEKIKHEEVDTDYYGGSCDTTRDVSDVDLLNNPLESTEVCSDHMQADSSSEIQILRVKEEILELKVECNIKEEAVIKSEIELAEEHHEVDDLHDNLCKEEEAVWQDGSLEYCNVVPVSLKSNIDFHYCEDPPLEVSLGLSPILSEAEESREIIISDRGLPDEKLRELTDDAGDLLALQGFQCLICNKRYRYLSTFRRHEKMHEITRSPLSFDSPTKTTLIKDITVGTDSGGGDHSCSCGKGFRRKSSVAACMRAHINAGLACQWCPRVFKKQPQLRRHWCAEHPLLLRDRFRCSTCKKVLGSKRALVRHESSHIKKKVEPLDEDSPSCAEDSQLENPIAEEEPHSKDSAVKFEFMCRTCGIGCSTLGALSIHKSTHRKGLFECSRCFEGFPTRAELGVHRRLHCLPSAHICHVCSRSFSTRDLMLRHKETHPFVIFAKDDSTHTQIFFK